MTEQRAASEPQIVTRTTRLSTNGRTSIVVEPPRPCGLTECAGEMHVTVGHDTTRIHLSARQRVELIEALGGETPEDGLKGAVAEDLAYDRGYKEGFAKAAEWDEVGR